MRVKKADLFNALYELNEAAGYESRLAMHAGYDLETASLMHGEGYYLLHFGRASYCLCVGMENPSNYANALMVDHIQSCQGLRDTLNMINTVKRHVRVLKRQDTAKYLNTLVEERF